MKKIATISIMTLFVGGTALASQFKDTSLLTEENCRKIRNANLVDDASINEQISLVKEECTKKYPKLK